MILTGQLCRVKTSSRVIVHPSLRKDNVMLLVSILEDYHIQCFNFICLNTLCGVQLTKKGVESLLNEITL